VLLALSVVIIALKVKHVALQFVPCVFDFLEFFLELIILLNLLKLVAFVVST
jgi:hypothetical protein